MGKSKFLRWTILVLVGLFVYASLGCMHNSDKPKSVEYDVIKYPGSSGPQNSGIMADGRSTWARVMYINSPNDLKELPKYGSIPAQLKNKIESTNFDKSKVISVVATAPNACFRKLAVSKLKYKSGSITGTVRATRGEDSGRRMCAEVISFPAALIRLDISQEDINDISLRIIDGWENSVNLSVSPASPVAENRIQSNTPKSD